VAKSSEQKRVEALREIEEIKARMAGKTGAELAAEQQKLEVHQAYVASLEKGSDYHEKAVLAAERLLEKYEASNKSIKQGLAVGRQTIEVNDIKLRQLEDQLKNDELSFEKYLEQREELLKQNGLLESRNKIMGEFVTDQEVSNKAAADFGKSLSKSATVYNTSFGAEKLKNLSAALQGGGASAAKFGAEMLTSFSDAMVDNMIGVVQEAYNAEQAFQRTTGASKEMARSMTNAYENVRETGASMEQVSAAGQALFGTYTDFTMLSGEMQESLTETSAVLAQLGVSNADFAAGIQISTKALGMSTDAAEETQRELVTFAKELGVAPSKMAADFAGAGDMMAKMGDQGVDAFKDLAHASKVTGMEMQKILAITNKFDTFEGAADQAGKLNAAMGGNFVNAMDLMMATDPAERFGMLRDSILDSGQSFDEMSYYQKNFYKDSLGLADVGDLALMLSGDMDNLGGATEETAASLIEQKEAAASLQDIQTQFKALMASMVPIIKPLIDLLGGAMKVLKGWEPVLAVGAGLLLAFKLELIAFNFILGVSKMIMSTVAGIQTAWTFAKGLFATAQVAETAAVGADIPVKLADAAANEADALSTGANTAAKGASIPVTKAAGMAAKMSAKHIMAMGLAVLLVGAGIGIAAFGLAQMVAAFSGLGEAAWPAAAAVVGFTLAFIGLVVALAFLATSGAGPVAAALMLAIGVAALMMGGGMALAGLGLAQLLGAFGGFDPNVMWGFAKGLGAIVLSVLAFGNPIATFGIMNITLMAGAFMLLGASIALVGMSAAETFERIAEAVDSMPTAKTVLMTGMMTATAAAAAVTAPAKMVASAVGAATGGGGGGGATQRVRQPISLTLNGKALEDFIIEVIGKEIIAINVV